MEKKFAEKTLTIAPGQEETLKLSEKWENPKLWRPDDPTAVHCHDPAYRRRQNHRCEKDEIRLPPMGMVGPAFHAQRRTLASSR